MFFDPSRKRRRMVRRDIEGRGISDPDVLRAMGSVRRESFVPPRWAAMAYRDRALPLGDGQTISQPYMVAAMTEALRLRPGDRVLEIGTGSGYQTAVLAEIAERVYTVERLASLSDRARTLLGELGYGNIDFRVGDGTLGWPEEAPFDAILVTAAAPEIPDPLLHQLSDSGGRLVAPVGTRALQSLIRLVRNRAEVETEELMSCRFVPLLGEAGWSE